MNLYSKAASISRCLPVLFFLLLSVLVYPSCYADENSINQENAQRLQQLRERISSLRNVLDKVRSKRGKVQNELRRAEKSISRINRKLRKLRKQIRSQKKKLTTLYSERDLLQKGLSRQRVLLGSQVRASYVMGRQEQLKIVLNQGDPSTVKRALVYYDYLNRSRTQQIHKVIKELEQLQIVEEKIVVEKRTFEQLSETQKQKKLDLVKTRNDRKKILKSLNREINSKDKKLGRMLRDEKELQRILKVVEEAAIEIPDRDLQDKPFASLKGRLPWPTNGKIKTRFGSRVGKGGFRRKGMVIKANLGKDVKVIARGRVAFSDWLRGYGLLMIVDHGDGFMTLYGHNQSLYKEIGEWVEAGETIASIGNSGGQSSSQLYFELRHKGKPINPAKWCKRTHGGIVGLR